MSKQEEVIELTDKDGKKVKFKFLDIIEKDNEEYILLLPEDSNNEVEVFKIQESDTKDEVEYKLVIDEKIAQEIFDEFMRRRNEE